MRFITFLFILISTGLFSQKSNFELKDILSNPQDVEAVCYSDGTDTLRGWKIHTSDVIDGYGFVIVDIEGNEVPGAFEVDPSLCEYRPSECVESQEWTYGIDNTGTRFNDVASYVITLSDGSNLLFSQDGSSGSWTQQLTEWATNIQTAADDAGLAWFVEPRFIDTSNPSNIDGTINGPGGTPSGLPGAPSVPIAIALDAGGMAWRYVNFQICPGQPVPVRAQRLTSQIYGDGEYDLTAAGAVLGPIQKFYVCRDCGKEPAWYLEDGITLANEGQIPNCFEPCGTLALTEAPPDKECDYQTLIGCDNNNSEILADFTPNITRRATVCNGEQIAVDYFQEDPMDPSALIPYAINGVFVDCATGESVPIPVVDTILSTTSIVKCYGSDANAESEYENTDNATDASFSVGGGGSTQMKWEYNQNGFNSEGINDFTQDITSCIDGGDVAKLSVTDVSGNVVTFDATSYTVVGTDFLLFDGVGSASLAGKVLDAQLVCGEGSLSGQAYLCGLCGSAGKWFDVITGEEIDASTLYDCPSVCENEIIEGTACLTSDDTQPVLYFIERDCEGVVLSSNYLLPDGTSVDAGDVTTNCSGDFDLAQIKDCVVDENNVQWIRYAFFIDGVLDSEFFVNQSDVSDIQTDIGDYTACKRVLYVSVSEIEVCADGSPAIRRILLDEDGNETIQYFNNSGLITPVNVIPGSCTKTSECVKWRNKYLGIDNTGTSFSVTYEIEVRDDNGVVGTFTQTPTANNTEQLNQWIVGLQTLYPNALIEQRYAPNGGAGLPPPTAGLNFDQMAARYVQFTACDGDDLPTGLFIISQDGNPITPPNEMDTQVIFGEEVRGYVCYECGIEPVVYYTDGTPVDLADIPPCYITCAENFEEGISTFVTQRTAICVSGSPVYLVDWSDGTQTTQMPVNGEDDWCTCNNN